MKNQRTQNGGIPEAIDDNQNGFLAPPKNPAALSEKVNELLNDPKTAKKMGTNGRNKAIHQFNWDNTAKAYEKMY